MNDFIIREVDFNDTENFMWASNLKEVASAWGAWKEGEQLDFSLIFSPGDFNNNFR